MMNLYHQNLVRFHTNWWEECNPVLQEIIYQQI